MTTFTSYANDITAETRIASIHCSGCGVVYGLGAKFIQTRKEDHRTWYCPNGHSQYYPAPKRSQEDILREQLEASRSLAKRERERREQAERQRAAARGQVTKIKRRVGRGVCPCCNRTFADLGRHMAGQHPEFADGGAA